MIMTPDVELHACGGSLIRNQHERVIGAVIARVSGLFDAHVARIGKVGAFDTFDKAEKAVRSGARSKKAARAAAARNVVPMPNAATAMPNAAIATRAVSSGRNRP